MARSAAVTPVATATKTQFRADDEARQVRKGTTQAIGCDHGDETDRCRPRAAHDRAPMDRRDDERFKETGAALPWLMPETLRGLHPDRLERSCGTRGDSIQFGAIAPGLERAEVHLTTRAFERHRHDTYATGITIAGVQSSWYRGARRICLPGQVHLLHPDEIHDGVRGFKMPVRWSRPAVCAGLRAFTRARDYQFALGFATRKLKVEERRSCSSCALRAGAGSIGYMLLSFGTSPSQLCCG
jgi:AraC-like protein